MGGRDGDIDEQRVLIVDRRKDVCGEWRFGSGASISFNVSVLQSGNTRYKFTKRDVTLDFFLSKDSKVRVSAKSS